MNLNLPWNRTKGVDTQTAARRCGLTFRQMDYLLRRYPQFEPALPANGSGSHRRFDENDLVRLQLYSNLLQVGFPTGRAVDLVMQAQHMDLDMERVVFLIRGNKITIGEDTEDGN